MKILPLHERVPMRFFKYKKDYVAVFLFPKGDNLITGKHLIFRSTQIGDPVLVLEHFTFDDKHDYILDHGNISKWKDNEIRLSEVLVLASMNESQLFNHISSHIGSWVLSSLQNDSTILLNWLLPEYATGQSSENISKLQDEVKNVSADDQSEEPIKDDLKDIARLRFFSKEDRRLIVIDGKSDLFLIVELMPTPNCQGYATFNFRQDRPFYNEIEQPEWKDFELDEQKFIDSIPNINNILRNLIESTNELFGLDSIQFIKMLSFSDVKEMVIEKFNNDKIKEATDG